MKKNCSLTKLLIAVMAAATLCACEKPAAPVETPVEVVEETVVEDPAPVVEEPEVVEAVEEENEPSFILLDENGDLYVPQHVTKDDFYEKIAEAEKEYKFESDWERDKFVAFALNRNSTFMNEEDICYVFEDYLGNFGWNTYFNYEGIEQQNIKDNKNKIPFSAYFIDPVLAEEADAFEKYIDANGVSATTDLILNNLKSIDAEECYVNNPLIYEESRICQCFEAEDYIPLGTERVNYGMYCYNVLDNNKLIDISNEPTYKISEYVSSHQE